MRGKKDSDPDKIRRRWVIFITIFAFLLSVFMSTFSDILLRKSNTAVAFIVLIAIIFIGILFDIIGVAVTVTDEKPFHSMAASKVKGAKSSLMLIRNASRVSNVCNDVIGDICGVISGSAAAVIAARAVLGMESTKATIVTLGMSALVAAVTVGGKAVGKTFAMGGSVQVVRSTAKVLCFFRTIFQNKRRK